MRMLGLAMVVAAACASAATPAQQAPGFDGERALTHVRRLVEIGPRPAGSPAIEKSRAYITEQLAAVGVKAEEQRFEARTPRGTVDMVNIRATIPARSGQAKGAGRLLITGHYDTKIFDDATFVGANDGGSSAGFLLELARVLAARQNALPIELVFFDGEEAVIDWDLDSDAVYGSRHYVEAAKADGSLKDIRAMVLVDMIGDANLTIKRDSHSTAWLNDLIWSAANRLGRKEFVNLPTTVEDDHIPFLEAGVPAVDIIDLEYPDETNRFWHTAEDTLDKVSAASLQAVGEVLVEALKGIETRLGPM